MLVRCRRGVSAATSPLAGLNYSVCFSYIVSSRSHRFSFCS